MLSGSDLASFPRFGRKGAHLRIRYDLAFSDSADLHSLVLPEKDAEGGASTTSYPIARLHYTVDLAR